MTVVFHLYPKISTIMLLYLYLRYSCYTCITCIITHILFRIIDNAKLLGERLQEATKKHPQMQVKFNKINVEFRTMDKDINTVRPQLMKLQREKDHYTRYTVDAELTLVVYAGIEVTRRKSKSSAAPF